MFDPNFVRSLPEDPYKAAKQVTRYFKLKIQEHGTTNLLKLSDSKIDNLYHNQYIPAHAFLKSFIQKYDITFSLPGLNLHNPSTENIPQIIEWFFSFDEWAKTAKVEEIYIKADSLYQDIFNHAPSLYELTDDEHQHIQQLIDQLRIAIETAEYLTDEHRRRLLSKLEKMQAEFHKAMSCFDSFLSMWLALGIAANKFGQDIKPLTDRFGEIMQAIGQVISRTEDLTKPLRLPMVNDYIDKQLPEATKTPNPS